MKRIQWEHNDCIQPEYLATVAFCNDLTKLILIFERRNVSNDISQIESGEKATHKHNKQRPMTSNIKIYMSNISTKTVAPRYVIKTYVATKKMKTTFCLPPFQ